MSRTYLKIKIKNLADESRTIRSEERKSLQAGRSLRADGKPSDAKYTEFNGLRDHRLTVVRPASRANGLAYGFLLGHAYATMERKTEASPDFRAILKVAKKFGTPEDLLRWPAWQEAAVAHLKEQGLYPWNLTSERDWKEAA